MLTVLTTLPLHPAPVYQVFDQQRHDGVRVDKTPVGVHGADAVGVAVGRQPDPVLAGQHLVDQRAEVAGDRFGMNAVKAGVHLAAQFDHAAACLLQQFAQVDAPGPVHGIHRHADVGGADGVEVHQLVHLARVGGEGVEAVSPGQPALDGKSSSPGCGGVPLAATMRRSTSLQSAGLAEPPKAALSLMPL